jgi:hypothetical protein
MDKNIQPQDKVGLNKKEHSDKRTEINSTVKKVDLYNEDKKNSDLKPTNEITKNIHIKPADEQMFEDNN